MTDKKIKELKMEPLLDYDSLAELTGLTASFLKKAKWKMNLPHYKIGAQVKFRISEVELWLKQRKAAG
jgi:predicted DNA-binding transcriptional regulator AlpA